MSRFARCVAALASSLLVLLCASGAAWADAAKGPDASSGSADGLPTSTAASARPVLDIATVEVVEGGPSTSLLEGASPTDVFEHAGGHTVLREDEVRESGANALPEVLRRAPGVKVVENSGTGNADTKLNVGIRGLNPRLTARSTVLLDEIPIAVAPYGQPQASLFPVSLFSISGLNVMRGGAAMRYGPQTVGGVLNLSTHAVPREWEARFASQGDQYGNFLSGVSLGTTAGPVGVYGEYSFRGGQGYRDHSSNTIHAGLFKTQIQLAKNTQLWGLFHVYDEASELPGGLDPQSFDENPRQSLRPNDTFDGGRQGVGFKLTHDFSDRIRGEVLSYYNHSKRTYVMAKGPKGSTNASVLVRTPRAYHSFGVEPRVAWAFDLLGLQTTVHSGYRFSWEGARQEGVNQTLPTEFGTAGAPGGGGSGSSGGGGGQVPDEVFQDDKSHMLAHALYLETEIWAVPEVLRFSAGVRGEYVTLVRERFQEGDTLRTDYWVPLPGASAWYRFMDGMAAFASYSRSFGSPQFHQLGLAEHPDRLTAEVADTGEVGLKLLEVYGMEASATGFIIDFKDKIACDEQLCENLGRSVHRGAELSWNAYVGDWAAVLEGLSFDLGYTYTRATATSNAESERFEGTRVVPWAPAHSVWGEVNYETQAPLVVRGDMLRVGMNAWWESAYFTDARNTIDPSDPTVASSPPGSVGEVPANWVLGARASYTVPLGDTLALNVSGGVRNMLNRKYFDRTEDRNAGMLLARPFTAWGGVNLKWVPGGL